MICLPSRGVAISVNVHNVDLNIFCDWIEASSCFLGIDISGSDIVDILIENNLYRDQDFAWELVNDAFAILRVRSRLLGEGYPLNVTADGVNPKSGWEQYSAYAFCLMLSLAKSHPVWVRDNFGNNFTTQGELFEELTAEVLKVTFSDWKIHPTGWTRVRTVRLKRIVEEICSMLNEATGDLQNWTKPTAKEAGLDIISFRPYLDGNVGVPVYLWQCASGVDWVKKQKTPDIDLWSRIVSWAVTPRKALSMPFALSDTDVRQHSVIVQGLLLDRNRLLEAGINNADWLSDDLNNQLILWLRPRIAVIPMLAAAI